jgi:hypothetical protein
MGTDVNDVRVRRSSTDDAFLVEYRRSNAAGPGVLRVARPSGGTGWMIYSPTGTALLRSPLREQAIEFAVRLAEAH